MNGVGPRKAAMARKNRSWPEPGEPLPSPVMDNHTHLPLTEREIPSANGYKMPIEEQIGLAERMRVTRFITVGCALPDLDGTVELARQWPQVKAALALHPNEAALHAGFLDESPDGHTHHQQDHHVPLVVALERVSALLSDPEVVAVGESGLDYFRTAEPGREAQKESFEIHLELARAHNLPLQIHVRDAYPDAIGLLNDAAWDDQPIVFHCFTGDMLAAQQIADKGWYASFAGPLTYPANEEMRRALLLIPRSRILVETDAPYLTPVPYRGAPNASYSMPYTVRQIADLWAASVEETCDTLMTNSKNLYGTW